MPDDGTSPMHRYTPVKSLNPVKYVRAHPVKTDMTVITPVKIFSSNHIPSSSHMPQQQQQQQPLRVHVSNEVPRYHEHFLKLVLPYYEAQWRNGNISGLIVHSGSGDTPVPFRIAKVCD